MYMPSLQLNAFFYDGKKNVGFKWAQIELWGWWQKKFIVRPLGMLGM